MRGGGSGKKTLSKLGSRKHGEKIEGDRKKSQKHTKGTELGDSDTVEFKKIRKQKI